LISYAILRFLPIHYKLRSLAALADEDEDEDDDQDQDEDEE
jgi:hypothetical protein